MEKPRKKSVGELIYELQIVVEELVEAEERGKRGGKIWRARRRQEALRKTRKKVWDPE